MELREGGHSTPLDAAPEKGDVESVRIELGSQVIGLKEAETVDRIAIQPRLCESSPTGTSLREQSPTV